MSKHTPGPWKVPLDGKGQAWQESRYPFLWHAGVHTRPILREDGQCTAVLGHKCYGATQAEAEANAQLIAAAPELLESCEEVLNRIDAMPEIIDLIGNAEYDRLCAAIAKAGGGE